MNFLLVYPRYFNGFWSFESRLRYIFDIKGFPPVVLLTLSSKLPKEWNKKLIDMNVKNICVEDIQWADYVFMSAVLNQRKSANTVIEKCKKLNTKTIACGSLFANNDEYYKKIDHLFLDEDDETLPQFLASLIERNSAQKYISIEANPNFNPAY
jgi:hypothetical protein